MADHQVIDAKVSLGIFNTYFLRAKYTGISAFLSNFVGGTDVVNKLVYQI